MCNCGRRYWNLRFGARAVARGDVKTVIAEAKDFAETALADLKNFVVKEDAPE